MRTGPGTTAIAVGRPWPYRIDGHGPPWPDGAIYQYDTSGHQVVLLLGFARLSEVTEIRFRPAHLWLCVSGPLIVLILRIGRLWFDAPFSVHLVPPERRAVPGPAVSPESRPLVRVILVDGMSGLVRAIRALTVSPEFGRALDDAIRAQAAMPWDEHEFDRALAELRAAYREPEDLTRSALCVAASEGGA